MIDLEKLLERQARRAEYIKNRNTKAYLASRRRRYRERKKERDRFALERRQAFRLPAGPEREAELKRLKEWSDRLPWVAVAPRRRASFASRLNAERPVTPAAIAPPSPRATPEEVEARRRQAVQERYARLVASYYAAKGENAELARWNREQIDEIERRERAWLTPAS
jgi:hypothetical protein